MPPRRIAQVIATLDYGGAARQLTLLAPRLPRDEFEVHVLALSRGGACERPLREAGVPVTVLGQRSWLDPAAFWRAREWLRRLSPDVVHTWRFAANSCGRAAALAAGLRTLVATECRPEPWKHWPQRAVDRGLGRRTTRIVVNTVAVRDDCVAAGIAAGKIVVIPGGIPPHVPGAMSRSTLLAGLGLPADARLIACVGSLRPEKRVKDVIWAADLLKVIRDDVHLLIVGDGPQRAGLMHYRDLVEIRDRVHFLGPRDDVPAIVEHCDLLWLGSASEGLPNSVMEALSAGVPVVATDIAGVRDLVTHGQHGFLVPVGDRAALARYANKLLDEPALARQLGAAGRERMLREFTVEALVRRHAELYRGLIEDAGC